MRHLIPVSGGKDSSALALWLTAHRPDLNTDGRTIPSTT
jgi:tRNA(Ile)-lysidine synthase TilS/MesJ